MSVTVRLFAAFSEAVGATRLAVSVADGTTVGKLWDRLVSEHPDLRRYPPSAAVNATFAQRDTVVTDGDDVAFLPPVSGG
ncbi:MAG: MoaD/ThiS family protein [Anaerolineae bacterium]